MPELAIASRTVLVIVFLLSASSKVRSRGAFAEFVASLVSLTGLPTQRAPAVAAVVATGEMTVVVLMFVPAPPVALAGFLLAAFLLAAFTVAIINAIRRAVLVPCRCFGGSTNPIRPTDGVRNLILMGVAGVGCANLRIWPIPIPLGSLLITVFAAGVVSWWLINLADVKWLVGSTPVVAPGAPTRLDIN
jgi:hypothetical protein